MRMPHESKSSLNGRLNGACVFMACVLAALGCGDDDAAVDSGRVDSGVDSGAVDSGADVGASDAGADAGAADVGADVDAGCVLPAPRVVRFTTDDGVDLEADHYPVAAGSPAVVLLHMIPPANTRANYPLAFREALYCRGIAVLNVDRRGAGGSEGVPTEAYEGPNGALDAKGAVEWMLAEEAAPDPLRIGIVGASNGTTTLLDFSVFSVMARTVEEPAAVVLLSGGTYTTNQNPLDELAFDGAPALFVYPAAEAGWNETVAVDAPDVWRFVEIDPGAHGTGLFTAAPTTIPLVADFLATSL